ncbi:MAG: helix-turn-helix transcriptional regulator [Bacteroidetes bacterium]|nr:helix-turn-helix transcriptional regulator [Bacteroidota bacterium]
MNSKNIDKNTSLICNDNNNKLILQIKNDTNEVIKSTYQIDPNYIQFFFSLKGSSNVAFNMPHCRVQIDAYNSYLVFFKNTPMNLYFDINPNSNLIAILININHFHNLFNVEDKEMAIFNTLKGDQPIITPKVINSEIANHLEQIIDNKISKSLQPLFLRGKIYEILSLYFNDEVNADIEQCPFIPNSTDVSKYKRVKEIITKNMINPPALEDLAAEVGLNIKKLKEGFKDHYGMPVFTYLYHYKMEYARNLLDENQQNINEIASDVGYSSATHFIAAFKRKFGITPKQYSLHKLSNIE